MSVPVGHPYLAWNDALTGRFFHPGASGQQVYLYVTEDVIVEVGDSLGGGAIDEFIAAVRAGPPGVTRAGHCQRALQVALGWRERGFGYPPYVAYLALFVLAGGHEGEFAPHAYYPRLWELLGEHGTGSPPSFERMVELWDDLERWSTRDRGGELGVFEASIVGGWVHVGLPLAQTVLTEGERAALPKIFAEAQLEPGIPPSNRELYRALVQYGRSILRPRTVRALERGSDAFKEALLDLVADDFVAWNGDVQVLENREGPREVHAPLRLCLAVDRIAGTAHATVRCHSKREMPGEGLDLDGFGERFRCIESVPQWSSPLARALTGDEFEPSPSAWSSGMVVADTARGWQLRLRPARVRIFVEGTAAGLPGLVEAVGLPLHAAFYLAFRVADWPALCAWAEEDCEGWHELPITAGLPSGWALAAVEEARTDRGPRQLDASAAFPDRVSIRLVGGIRSSTAGNSFFPFALPRVAVDGAGRDDTVYCAGRRLQSGPDSPGSYNIPDGLPLETRIVVEVRRDEEPVRRLSLYLASTFSWRFQTPLVVLDRFGMPITGGPTQGGIAGAVAPPAAQPLRPDVFRTPDLRPEADMVFFVGKHPGAIARWPVDPMPSWEPVWAIPFGRRGRAIYCGSCLSASKPSRKPQGSRRQRALWRRVLWQWRKRITPPSDPYLKVLWRQYREVARDA